MQTTTNYKLKKPDLTDVVDIQNFNDNADIIDSELSKRALKTDIKVTSVAGKTGTVTLSKSDVGLGNSLSIISALSLKFCISTTSVKSGFFNL